MKCLLAIAPYIEGNIEILNRHESLALGYLATCLRKSGHDVDILNAPMKGYSQNEILTHIHKGDYQLIGFNLSDPALVESTVKNIQCIRAAGYKNHICMGGYTSTFSYEELLKLCPEIDSIVLYEGEDTICEIAKSLNSNGDWKKISGIAYIEHNNIIKNSPRQIRHNLDSFQFPARDDLAYILKNNLVIKVPVLGSRGCHFNCSFCSVRAFYECDGKST
ncbi:cobalamin-dependent protein, partial [Candidatus Pacearchaeota archaeon]|nr:cobalamin-dependent protein [Candidatus Pacearchaeota archaeon]